MRAGGGRDGGKCSIPIVSDRGAIAVHLPFEHAVFGLKSYFCFRLSQQIKRAETDMDCSLANGMFKRKMDIDRLGPRNIFLSLMPFTALFLFILYFPYETHVH